MKLPLLALAVLPQAADSFAAVSERTTDPCSDVPNVLIVIADDFGVDQVGAYGEGDSPCTPNLDRMASEGMLFRNAWTNPVCTPSRASLLTGKHAFRLGIGAPGAGSVLAMSETTLAEALPLHTSAWLGKWHLGGNNANHPNTGGGFDLYAGNTRGAVPDYYDWPKTINGVTIPRTSYATVETASDAILAIQLLPEPWLLVVSFNAPHTPFQAPPSWACPEDDCPDGDCADLPGNPSNSQVGRAMIEALDNEFGRVLGAVDTFDPCAYVFFMGDNGTARQLVRPPFLNGRAKGSVYEGGVNVPLLVRGPGVKAAECEGLVGSVDLFATIGELVGTPIAGDDSVSMVPYFERPDLSLRSFIYAESYEPNGPPPFTRHDRCVRDERYKLIRRLDEPDELYDLANDAFEQDNLLPNLSDAEHVAYDALVAEFERLGVE